MACTAHVKASNVNTLSSIQYSIQLPQQRHKTMITLYFHEETKHGCVCLHTGLFISIIDQLTNFFEKRGVDSAGEWNTFKKRVPPLCYVSDAIRQTTIFEQLLRKLYKLVN